METKIDQVNNSDVTVVMYHYVRDIKNSHFSAIQGLETELFIEQIFLSFENKKENEVLIDENTRIRIQLESYKSKVVDQNIDTNSILSKYYFVSRNNSRPINIRLISEVPAPISYSFASLKSRPAGNSFI